jgi:hypothetical protein
MYDPGAFVQSAEGNNAAQPLLKIVRDDKVRVTFSLSQKDIAGLKKGVKVTLGEIDALPDQKFEGTVSRSPPNSIRRPGWCVLKWTWITRTGNSCPAFLGARRRLSIPRTGNRHLGTDLR